METEPGRSAPSKHPVSDPLRAAIAARGLTAFAIARSAGVDPGVVKRYLDGRRGLSLATADKLAAALGLRLVGAEAAALPPRPAPSPRAERAG